MEGGAVPTRVAGAGHSASIMWADGSKTANFV